MQGPEGIGKQAGVNPVDASGIRNVRKVSLNIPAASGGAGKPAESSAAASISGTGVPVQAGQALLAMMAGSGQVASGNFPLISGAKSAEPPFKNIAIAEQMDAILGDGPEATAKFQELIDRASRLDEVSLRGSGLSLEQLKAEEAAHRVNLASQEFMAGMKALVAQASRSDGGLPNTADIVHKFHDSHE